jgi:hypothetical protein
MKWHHHENIIKKMKGGAGWASLAKCGGALAHRARGENENENVNESGEMKRK